MTLEEKIKKELEKEVEKMTLEEKTKKELEKVTKEIKTILDEEGKVIMMVADEATEKIKQILNKFGEGEE